MKVLKSTGKIIATAEALYRSSYVSWHGKSYCTGFIASMPFRTVMIALLRHEFMEMQRISFKERYPKFQYQEYCSNFPITVCLNCVLQSRCSEYGAPNPNRQECQREIDIIKDKEFEDIPPKGEFDLYG